MPMSGGKIVRVGIMCNSATVEKWKAETLKKLLEVNGVEISVFIINDQTDQPATLLDKIRLLSSNSLFFAYEQLTKKKLNSNEFVDVLSMFSQTAQIRCKPVKKENDIQTLSEEDIVTIERYDLDVILQFGFKKICDKILDIPRYGVWVFQHDTERYSTGPSCFWETYNGQAITETALLRLTKSFDRVVVLRKGYYSTVNNSYVQNKDKISFLSTDWAACVCKDIISGEDISYLDVRNAKAETPIYCIPNNWQMIGYLKRIIFNSLVKLFKKLFISEMWNIGIVNEPISVFLERNNKPDVQWFPVPSKGCYRADPFALIDDTRRLILLVEEFDYESGKGYILSFEGINLEKGKVSFKSPIISKSIVESNIHMSYPYLIEYQGEVYCIPETSSAREVSIYKAVKLPDKWEKVCTIIKGFALVDCTIFLYDGYWWLFGTDRESDPQSKLCIWYSSDLFGQWMAHLANPVKDDVRSSRSAGTPFIYKGQLYRPAQDCSKIYGGQVAINKITKLTISAFEEETVLGIEPYKDSCYPHGLHTISAAGDKTIIDSKREVFDIYCSIKKIRRKLKHKAK